MKGIKAKGKKQGFVGRVKIYGKGTLNIPKEVLEILGVQSGEELIISAKEGMVELRRPKSIKDLIGSLKGLEIDEKDVRKVKEYAYYGLRNAFADAYEFFEDLKGGVPYGGGFIVGESHGKVYLQIEKGDLRKTIHFSYIELPLYPNGLITIESGIKEFLEGENDRRRVDENKKIIREALVDLINIEEFGENGFILIVEPEFSRKEMALLGVIVEKIKSLSLLSRFS